MSTLAVTALNLMAPIFGDNRHWNTIEYTPGNDFPDSVVVSRVGGNSYFYVEKELPDHEHARLRFVVMGRDSVEVEQKAAQVELALCQATIPTEPYGAPVGFYDETLKVHGTRQDFGVYHPR
jgi:hypothetical protein